MTKNIVLTATMSALVALTGCNTVDGAGKDLKSAGTAVSDASGQDKK